MRKTQKLNYIQELLSDEKYDEEDIICFIENLKNNSAKTFDSEILNSAKNIYQIPPKGIQKICFQIKMFYLLE